MAAIHPVTLFVINLLIDTLTHVLHSAFSLLKARLCSNCNTMSLNCWVFNTTTLFPVEFSKRQGVVWHAFLSLSVVLHAFLSLSVVWHAFLSLSVVWHAFLSLSVVWHAFLSLSVVWHAFLSLSVVWHAFISLSVVWHAFLSLSFVWHALDLMNYSATFIGFDSLS